MKRTSLMNTIAAMVILFFCFGSAWFTQWWSLLTLTTVGTVGTLTGCFSFVPLVNIGNALGLIAGFHKKLGKSRWMMFYFVIVVNVILMVTALNTIISAVSHLSKNWSFFTPRPENISTSSWLGMIATYFGPELIAIAIAIIGLARWKRTPQNEDDLGENIKEDQASSEKEQS